MNDLEKLERSYWQHMSKKEKEQYVIYIAKKIIELDPNSVVILGWIE